MNECVNDRMKKYSFGKNGKKNNFADVVLFKRRPLQVIY